MINCGDEWEGKDKWQIEMGIEKERVKKKKNRRRKRKGTKK